MEDTENLPVIKGRFMKGSSGNPRGRPVGSGNRHRNQIIALKLDMEGNLRKQLNRDARDILQRAIALALEGDQAMIKLLIDKMIPTSRAVEDETPTKERIQITINQMPTESKQIIEGEVYNEVI